MIPSVAIEVLRARRPLVALLGPTAVGKSRIGILVAASLETEVLTADSRQVFRGMDIGMDKPSEAERRGVPHRLIDLVAPNEPFNTGMYRRLAMQEIERVYAAGRIPLVVGGTGLYVRTLIRGLWSGPAADWSMRTRLMDQEREQGPGFLHRELRRVDPESAARLHPRDLLKIVRALEVYALSHRPLSDIHREHGFEDRPFTALMIGLNRDRAALYGRIDARVESQVSKGLIEETQRLLSEGHGRQLGSMKGLGYRQIAGYLVGEYDYAEAIRRLKRDTRHFAKRQLTWFRKEPDLRWLMIDERESPEDTAERVVAVIQEFLDGLSTSEASVRVRLSTTAVLQGAGAHADG